MIQHIDGGQRACAHDMEHAEDKCVHDMVHAEDIYMHEMVHAWSQRNNFLSIDSGWRREYLDVSTIVQ